MRKCIAGCINYYISFMVDKWKKEAQYWESVLYAGLSEVASGNQLFITNSEEVNFMFTCAKISFNQSMFLIDWLFNLRNLTARGHYYLVQIRHTMWQLQHEMILKKMNNKHGSSSMLCDEKSSSLCWFLKLHVAMGNKNKSSIPCLNIQINIL